MGMDVQVREFVSGDLGACRRLWAELTEHHRELYGDPTIGGDDPGSGSDDYLDIPDRVTSWVAVVDGEVVGLTGLLDRGSSGEVEPVVVAGTRRHQGIGQALMETVVSMAAQRGFEYLAIRPVARNVAVICNIDLTIDLTIDLKGRRHPWREGVNLHGLDFRY